MKNTALETCVELITPSKARSYLNKIPSYQRKIRPGRIDFLVRSILQGSFQLTHQGICFNEEGALIDGQHRLTAIVKADKPVHMMVTRGAPINTWQAVDTGGQRNLSDITGIDKRVSEPIRYILRLISIHEPTYQDAERVANSDIGLWLERLVAVCPTHRKLFSASKIKAMAALRAAMSDHDYPLYQYRALVLQDYSEMSPYIQSLCKQFINHGSLAEKQSEMVCRAYLAFDVNSSSKTKLVIKEFHPVIEEIRKQVKTIIQ
jgi:hypothetical protein